MSSTHIAYSATRRAVLIGYSVWWYRPTLCPVLIAYAPTPCLVLCYHMLLCSPVLSCGMLLRTAYAVSGAELAYAATACSY
eukprot:1784119-Rhodomonas_salina.1